MSHPEPLWIAKDGLKAKVQAYGATLVDLRLEGVAHPLILGLDPAAQKAHSDLYCGAVIGRVANRLGHGRAMLDDQSLRLPVNAPPHHLHGGPGSLSHRDWQLHHRTPESASFLFHSKSNALGYPGTLDVWATYQVLDGPALRITLEAEASEKTLVNLCHHPYFNLDGSSTIANHTLHIMANHFLPTDNTSLPTGDISPIKGTPYDYQSPRRIGPSPDLDHCFCLSTEKWTKLRPAASLEGGTGHKMQLWTTQPGLQVYDAKHISPGVPGLEGRLYQPYAGLALEAQGWPDAPNRPQFPDITLEAGVRYTQTTEYRFTLSDGCQSGLGTARTRYQ